MRCNNEFLGDNIMAYLGRRGALAPVSTADIPDNSITAAKIVAGAIDFQDEIGFLENKATTQNLSGTYSTERMYLNDSYTLTGDVTITGHLALGTVADSDVIITQDSTERTITGSGTLESGDLLHRAEDSTDLTGMTGELGSAVTGSPNLNLTTGSISSGVTGFTGIKYASLWRVHTNWTNTTSSATTDPVINWEKDDTFSPGTIGSDITESSGVFTFPSTGIWDVIFYHNWSITGSIRFTSAYIMVTTNNSSYSEASMSRSTATMVGNSSTMNNNFCNKLLDVSNTTNVKVRFKVDIQTNASNDVINKGETNRNDTYAVFTRIGDT